MFTIYGFADYKLKQLLVLSVIIIGILALIMMYWLSSFKKSFDVKVPDQYPLEIQLDQEAYKLERSFYSNQDEEIWPIILSGIKAVSKSQPNQPAVFMIIYNGLFVSKTTRCLAKDVSNLALKYLMLPNTSGKGPSMIIGKDLAKPYYIEDSGRILIDAKNEISKSGAMIVTDLQDVPPVVAKEFHYMCDKYSPLVAKAVYVFTLYIDDKLPYYKDWSKVAENSLRRLWKPHLSDEILEPLIARMTPSTIAITRELMSNIVRTC